MNSVVLLLLLCFVALATSSTTHHHRSLAVSLHSKIELSVLASASLEESSVLALEHGLLQFLNQYLDSSYNATQLALQSQTLHHEDMLLVLAFDIQATGVGDLSNSIVGIVEDHDEALELYFKTTFDIAAIRSIKSLDHAVAAVGIPSKNPNKAPFYSNDAPSLVPTITAAPSPSAVRVVLPTLAPKASKEEPPEPTPEPTLKGDKTPSPVAGAASLVPSEAPMTPSSVPSVNPSLTVSETASSAPTQAYQNLPNKLYQTQVTIKLFGILSVVPQNVTDFVESVTLSFLQDNLPPVARVILEVIQVNLKEQSLQQVLGRRRRLESTGVLLLDFDISGEGWSTSQDRLDGVDFDGLVRYTLLTGYDDYVSQLQVLDGLSDAASTPDNTSPVVLTQVPNNDTNSNGPSLVIPVIVTAVGVALLVAGLCAFVIFRRSDTSTTTSTTCTTTSNANDGVRGMDVSIDAESPYYDDGADDEDSYFQHIPSRILSRNPCPVQQLNREKYDVKEGFDESAVSALSMYGGGYDSDIDGWSITSGMGTIKTVADEVKLSMNVLDEFETKLASNSPDRRFMFDNKNDDEEEQDNP